MQWAVPPASVFCPLYHTESCPNTAGAPWGIRLGGTHHGVQRRARPYLPVETAIHTQTRLKQIR